MFFSNYGHFRDTYINSIKDYYLNPFQKSSLCVKIIHDMNNGLFISSSRSLFVICISDLRHFFKVNKYVNTHINNRLKNESINQSIYKNVNKCVPGNDPKDNCGTPFSSNSLLISEVASVPIFSIWFPFLD